MNNKFKIALCQYKITENKISNLEKVENIIKDAVSKGNPDIIVLPEYFNCPLGLESTKEHVEYEPFSQSLNLISRLASETKKYIIAGSLPIRESNSYEIYNTSYVFNRKGNEIARHKKVHLFDIDIPGKINYYESDILSKGSEFTAFETEYCKIGLGICYDIRFPEYSQILKQKYKVDLLIFPAAFNTITGPMHWELLQRSRALDNNVHIALCSPARNVENPSLYQCYGFSSIYDPFGKLVSTTGFEEDIVFGEIDLQKNRDIEKQIPTWKQKRNDMYELKGKKI